MANLYLFMSSFSGTLLLLLSACLSIDLILILRNPFKNPAVRTKWYNFVSFTYAIVTSLIIFFNYTNVGAEIAMNVIVYLIYGFIVAPALFFTI